jgi:exportin-T
VIIILFVVIGESLSISSFAAGGGKGRAAFCHTPAIDKEKRKFTDYSEFPLTAHGQMLYSLIQSGISAYPHPAVSIQFFETTCRYTDFFKVRKECVMPALHAMIDTRYDFLYYVCEKSDCIRSISGLHNPSSSVRARVFYLFHRFIKEARNEISSDLAGTLLESIRDLLPIEVDIPELENPEQQDLLTEAIKNPGLFDSQLYLFETAGVLISLFWRSTEQSASLLLSIVKPLMSELSVNLQAVETSREILPILKVHHGIMALGNVAKGFPDFPAPVPDGYILPPLDVFREIAQAILVSLEALNAIKGIRDAVGSISIVHFSFFVEAPCPFLD